MAAILGVFAVEGTGLFWGHAIGALGTGSMYAFPKKQKRTICRPATIQTAPLAGRKLNDEKSVIELIARPGETTT